MRLSSFINLVGIVAVTCAPNLGWAEEKLGCSYDELRASYQKLYPPKPPTSPESGRPQILDEHLDDQSLDFKLRLSQILNRDSGKMSEAFKMALLSNPDLVMAAAGSVVDNNQIGFLPSLPNKGDASLKPMSASNLAQLMPELFSTQQLGDLKKLRDSQKGSKPNENFLPSERKNIESPKVLPAEQNKVEQIFASARSALTAEISLNRKESELTQVERALVAKVQNVQLTWKTGTCAIHYSPDLNSISICPNSVHQSDASLLIQFAQQMARPITPCNSQYPLYKMNLAVLRKFKEESLKKDSEDIGNLFHFIRALPNLPDVDSIQMDGIALNSYSAQQMATALKTGVLTAETPVASFQDYPFQDVYQCLLKNQHVRKVTMDEIHQFADEVVKIKIERSPNRESYKPEDDKAAIIAAFNAKPECFKAYQSTQMNDAFSFWLAARVLARFWQKQAPQDPREKISAFSEMMPPTEQPTSNLSFDKTVEAAMADYRTGDGVGKSSFNSRHELYDRQIIEQIFMREPEIRNKLGCTENASETTCAHKQASGPDIKSHERGGTE